ncbi:MAG: CvpA family protein [Desulfotignum sp.]|nr:CvpA family protein [Desulfotignum sp.]MCF8125170.1 CvpA family protein [Desulfotignum sp.]
MNGFDLVVLVIVMFCMIRGLFRGLIREVSGIVGIIAGFYGAFTYYWILSPHLAFLIQSPATRHLTGFCILFCGILILVGLLAALIRRILHLVFLGWVDRTFGMIFGTAKGALIVSVLFVMLTAFVPAGIAPVMAKSESAPYLARISRAMTLFISRNMRVNFLEKLEKMKVEKSKTKEGNPIGNIGPCPGCYPDPEGEKRV